MVDYIEVTVKIHNKPKKLDNGCEILSSTTESFYLSEYKYNKLKEFLGKL